MAVVDASWWGVWWLWVLIWVGTIVAALVAVMITFVHWRRDRRTAVRRSRGIAVYLDNDSVMDVYHLRRGKYKAALSQKVKETISKDRKAQVSSALGPLGVSGGRTVNEEVVREFVEEEKPITVIGVVIDVLDQADDIVDVDLRTCEVIMSHARARDLDIADGEPRKAVRLHDVDAFVSVRGLFRWTGETDSTITLQAPYGRPADPAEGPQVHLTCAKSGLRGSAVPATGSFLARCLGRVTQWDAQECRLALDPIAIFR